MKTLVTVFCVFVALVGVILVWMAFPFSASGSGLTPLAVVAGVVAEGTRAVGTVMLHRSMRGDPRSLAFAMKASFLATLLVGSLYLVLGAAGRDSNAAWQFFVTDGTLLATQALVVGFTLWGLARSSARSG